MAKNQSLMLVTFRSEHSGNLIFIQPENIVSAKIIKSDNPINLIVCTSNLQTENPNMFTPPWNQIFEKILRKNQRWKRKIPLQILVLNYLFNFFLCKIKFWNNIFNDHRIQNPVLSESYRKILCSFQVNFQYIPTPSLPNSEKSFRWNFSSNCQTWVRDT